MLTGMGVSGGIGVAEALVWQPPIRHKYVPRQSVAPKADIIRFKTALTSTLEKNKEMAKRTALQIGADEASIFEAHCLILGDDENVSQPIQTMILEQSWSAEFAVLQHFNALANTMLTLDDEYMQQRADDFISLRDQLLYKLMGYVRIDASHLVRPTIVVAHRLMPFDLASIDRSRLEGVVCETGSFASHLSIILRALGIPAVVGVENICAQVKSGQTVALDGQSGKVWINPTRPELEALRRDNKEWVHKQKAEQKLRGALTISLDGHRVELLANAGPLEEVEEALDAGCEGIGMLRSELLYMDREGVPSEDEQVELYSNALKRLAGKALTIRTMDAMEGHWKPKENGRSGQNPALGYRGIRRSLGQPQQFGLQLRAILRASAFGRIKVLFPMMIDVDELTCALSALKQAKEELRSEKIPFDEKISAGVLIETPAGALLADAFVCHTNFVAVGINDLTQFTLAADRDNPQVAHLYNMMHPAVLRLIKRTIDAAHAQGKTCILCGEVLQSPQMVPLLMGIGVDGFSVSSSSILPVRSIINNSNYHRCRMLAAEILQMDDLREIQQRLSHWGEI